MRERGLSSNKRAIVIREIGKRSPYFSIRIDGHVLRITERDYPHLEDGTPDQKKAKKILENIRDVLNGDK